MGGSAEEIPKLRAMEIGGESAEAGVKVLDVNLTGMRGRMRLVIKISRL